MIHATEDEYVGVWLNQTQDSKWKYCPILHRFPSSIVRSSPGHFAISEHMLTNEDVAEPGALTEIFLESAVLELSKCGTLENPASFTNPTPATTSASYVGVGTTSFTNTFLRGILTSIDRYVWYHNV